MLRFSAALAWLVVLAGCRPPDPVLPSGKPDAPRLFARNCAPCHGADGSRGDPEMRLTALDSTPVEHIGAVIAEGGKGMPAWKSRFTPEQISALASYVKQLAGKPEAPARGTR